MCGNEPAGSRTNALQPGSEAATVRAFDAYAPRYDSDCGGQLFTSIRRRVHRVLEQNFPPGSRVLEIGCGTGIDAKFLAGRGVHVVAADPASRMLDVAADRLGGAATLIQAGLSEIDARLDPGLTFDGIFSDFGALNCVDRLDALGSLAAGRLVRGGRVVLCLISPICAWEIAYFLFTAHPRAAVRRFTFGGPVVVPFGKDTVATYYHRPRAVVRALGPGYDVCTLRGLPVFVPPPWLEPLWTRIPVRVQRVLSSLDRGLDSRFPFNRLGDHFLMEMMKR